MGSNGSSKLGTVCLRHSRVLVRAGEVSEMQAPSTGSSSSAGNGTIRRIYSSTLTMQRVTLEPLCEPNVIPCLQPPEGWFGQIYRRIVEDVELASPKQRSHLHSAQYPNRSSSLDGLSTNNILTWAFI